MFDMGNALSVRDDIDIEDIENAMNDLDNFDSESSDDYVLDANETVPPFMFQENVLSRVESQLDLDEKISLTYILYSNPMVALGEIKKIIDNEESTNILLNWYTKNKALPNVNDILLEAICVIQNYNALKGLSTQDKNQLKLRFLPRRPYSCLNLNHFRKVLYLICDNLNRMQTKRVIEYVKNDLKEEFIEFDDNFMEQYFLHWEILSYISRRNFNNLTKAFKQSKLEDYCLYLDHLNSNLGINGLLAFDEQATNVTSISQTSHCNGAIKPSYNNKTDSHQINKIPDENKYKIDVQVPGLCLIINQKVFHKEFDPKFGPFPDNFKSLDNRLGSEKDRDKLQRTFEVFNFKVIIMENLTHEELTEKIDKTAIEAGNYSTFFVCILSHGIEGHVYGANSLPVAINSIYSSLNKAKCQAKILILQACQGNVCQEVDLQTDGPTTSNSPSYRDMLVFWATVPGYAAIRDPRNGSWFIQIFCDKLMESSETHHFQDICILVKNEISYKYWNKNNKKYGTVPIVYSTFNKFLYLPPKQNLF